MDSFRGVIHSDVHRLDFGSCIRVVLRKLSKCLCSKKGLVKLSKWFRDTSKEIIFRIHQKLLTRSYTCEEEYKKTKFGHTCSTRLMIYV